MRGAPPAQAIGPMATGIGSHLPHQAAESCLEACNSSAGNHGPAWRATPPSSQENHCLELVYDN
eukprot:9493260-Pyramimonas_sp.AAC.1